MTIINILQLFPLYLPDKDIGEFFFDFKITLYKSVSDLEGIEVENRFLERSSNFQGFSIYTIQFEINNF